MTVRIADQKNDVRQIPILQTPEHECSYIEEEVATMLFIDPKQGVDENIYQQLIDIGFRRSGEHFYLPHCSNCSACIPVRIPVFQFMPTRKQQRVIKVNHDLEQKIVKSIDNEEYYSLYEKYIRKRHAEGDMYPPSRTQFRDFLLHFHPFTEFFTYYLKGKLVCVSVADRLDKSLSAIYTFYCPEHAKRSLGTFSILQQIKAARARHIDYLYLGYWIKNCRKMSYKSEYQPLQVYLNGSWKTLN